MYKISHPETARLTLRRGGRVTDIIFLSKVTRFTQSEPSEVDPDGDCSVVHFDNGTKEILDQPLDDISEELSRDL